MEKYIEITELEAKGIYCGGEQIYITNDKREFFRVPCSGDYGSHAPAEVLYTRSVPTHEGKIKFFIKEKYLGLWMEGNLPTYGGYKCSICGYQTTEFKLEHCPKCKRTMYIKYVGYKKIPAWTYK